MTRTRSPRAIRIAALTAAAAGLSLIVGLVVWSDAAALGRMLVSAGWGLALVSLAHLVPLAASALAWQAITRPAWRTDFLVFAWARLVREAVSGLLPVSQIGGDVIGARILTFHGSQARVAAAAVLADMTVELITQIVFTVIGVAVLLMVLGIGGDLLHWSLLGLLVAVIVAAGFVLAQRWGLFKLLERLLERIAGWLGWAEVGTFARLHDTVLALYRDRASLLRAHAWHLASWLIGAFEVWLTLYVLDFRVGFAEALVIESLGQAVRSAAFLVPGAFGVQEGGFMVIGMVFGLSPETALAVSLVKRVRELALGVPVLAAWQIVEGRRLFDNVADGADSSGGGQ